MGSDVQPNLNGLNTFVTMKRSSRQGEFELLIVNHSAGSEGVQ